MRRLTAVVLALGLAATPALANDGALVPGKPAGVKQANIAMPGILIAVGVLAGVGAMIAIVSSKSHVDNPAVVTTTTAP
jgi:hypothetical protein